MSAVLGGYDYWSHPTIQPILADIDDDGDLDVLDIVRLINIAQNT